TREPEHADCVKERRRGVPAALEELAPDAERAHRPARIDLVGTVAYSDDPRLASGAGTVVSRSEGIDERDPPSRELEVIRRPAAEHAGPDDRDVVAYRLSPPGSPSHSGNHDRLHQGPPLH